ncbi:unnamed protein product [Pleuronectes platessa]|uniref:Uncharacterized protein n=1 Tax=Pleuronectes platessa TaxID=8262 RepID=A0A9N7V8R2_PLEPL|nr:unnamed protein product [Pleuronectes platessa]
MESRFPIAFSELVTYIIEKKSASESSAPSVSRLAGLSMLYRQRLEQLGIDSPDVHATRLKDQLLQHIPDLQAEHHGRDILLAFKKDVGSILAEASKYGEAVHLAKAAGMIRCEMQLSNYPTEVSEDDLQMLENFEVVMYDRSSAATGVDEARLNLFAHKQRSYDAIPPTSAALIKHAKRAAYQAGIIWGQATGSPALHSAAVQSKFVPVCGPL